MKLTDTLFVITARGGSKGLPGKNIKNLCGKPLIAYSIDVARAFTNDENICVSTDSQEIIDVVENYGLKVPFIRPACLATDSATSNDVLVHVEGALNLYRDDIDMVYGMTKSHAPSILNEENEDGFMVSVFNKDGLGRQYVREMYETNGAVYVININSLLEKGMKGFTRKIKYVMSKEHSIDIDDIFDFLLVEAIMNNSKNDL